MNDSGPVAAQGLRGGEGPLVADHDLVILDLDGVVYVGPDAVPGAADALARVRAGAAGPEVTCCFLTNNASRTPQAVVDKLVGHEVPARLEEVVTSAQVAAAILAGRLDPGARVQVVGGPGLWDAVRDHGLEPVPDLDGEPVAVVQGFNPDLTWHDLAAGARAVRAGLFWVATNLDLTIPTADGPAPGNGTLIRAVATAAGRDPDAVAGKPSPEPFREAAHRMGAERAVVVGDRLDTDIEGARAAGMAALAVLSGVDGASALLGAPAHRRPTHLGRDVSALLDPHPAVEVDAGDAVRARCRSAEVVADDRSLTVPAAGEDPLDLLRAACAAQWAWADAHPDHAEDDGSRFAAVLDGLAADPSTGEWAR